MSYIEKNITEYIGTIILDNIWKYQRGSVPDIKVDSSNNAYSNRSSIFIGTGASSYFKISKYDVIMHEVFHIILEHSNIKKFPGYTHEQINIAGDLEINSILGLSGTEMNILYPTQLGLPIGLTTKEYLELLYPEGQTPQHITDNMHKCPRHGEDGKEVNPAGQGMSAPILEKDQAPADYVKNAMERNANTIKIDGNYDHSIEPGLKKFLEEAKLRSRVTFASNKRQISYTRLNRRSHNSSDVLMPGVLKTHDPIGSQRGYLPIIFVDISGSTEKIKVSQSIRNVLKYTRKDFIIAMYNEKLRFVSTPKDKVLTFKSQGSTNFFESLKQFIETYPDLWARLSEVFVVTDGEDSTLNRAADMIHKAGKGFQAQFINKYGESSRIDYKVM